MKQISRWHEKDGVIYLSATSDGTTGEGWIKRLEDKGFRVGDYAKQVLRSPDFRPTSGETYEIAILKGMLFQDSDRVTKKIRDEAARRKLGTPNAEVACLIREEFTDQELKAMGLMWIIIMHEPIEDSVGRPRIFGVIRDAFGLWLHAYCDEPDVQWNLDSGFAFIVLPDC